MKKNKKWYIDQYNRNRSYKDQVKTWKELVAKLKLDGNKKTL